MTHAAILSGLTLVLALLALPGTVWATWQAHCDYRAVRMAGRNGALLALARGAWRVEVTRLVIQVLLAATVSVILGLFNPHRVPPATSHGLMIVTLLLLISVLALGGSVESWRVRRAVLDHRHQHEDDGRMMGGQK